jgi:hypothetical protein
MEGRRRTRLLCATLLLLLLCVAARFQGAVCGGGGAEAAAAVLAPVKVERREGSSEEAPTKRKGAEAGSPELPLERRPPLDRYRYLMGANRVAVAPGGPLASPPQPLRPLPSFDQVWVNYRLEPPSEIVAAVW